MKIVFLKSRVRLYLAYVLYLLTSIFWPWYSREFYGKTRVIVFHHIDNASLFRKIIKSIKNRYNLISYQQYLDKDVSSSKINVIIALDDGYNSWFTNAFPVFQEFKVKPLLFVNSDFISLENNKAFNYCQNNITTWPEASLSWTQLANMMQMGAEIGGHALGHSDLSSEHNENHLLQLISDDRAIIARELQFSPRCFTYPFGRYSLQAMQAVEASGYLYGFSSDSGFLEDSSANFCLKRTNVGLRPAGVVCAAIEGWGDVVSKWVRQIKCQLGR